ncbi:hypothetical protein K0B96_09315 [Horticoccus luteus]|uniref:Uncharacterized protein n=1 Tax=Horticoccus luteus TaxID=2862869 RepID=A0A8F9XJY1_9BACT|nr:hypothetical protein [Horticoccus luteus]QYM77529.1 hypothetical protein K0B96_09315 [Horticoccus luteus]
MHLQPNRDYVSNDDVQTPPALARRLVQHFQPRGRILEPCRGEGNFYRALRAHLRGATADSRANGRLGGQRRARAGESVAWTEIKAGRDFFACTDTFDWIITNPPWSEIRRFLQHAMQHADNVVFLLTINHVWTKARLRDIRAADFGLKEIVLVDMPASFPQSGFQLGAVHVQRGWHGAIALSDLGAAGRSSPAHHADLR